jgi:hypothetical protein
LRPVMVTIEFAVMVIFSITLMGVQPAFDEQ